MRTDRKKSRAPNPKSERPPSARRRLPRSLPPTSLLGEELHHYSIADVKRLFKLPASLLHALARAGYMTASVREGTTTFSFQDLLILRTASALRAAKIPLATIVEALGHLRNALPPGSVLTTMALGAWNQTVDARTDARAWEDHSGQYSLPLDDRAASVVTPLPTRGLLPARLVEADAHYARGHALEDSDVHAARAAYIDALNAHSDHVEARINLGRLLHLNGELKQAEKVYRQAKTSSALLSFNLAILLEDLDREEDAIIAYREALAQDPQLHDAHFNLSRLHERAKKPREALRHLLAYRRQVRQLGN